MDYLIYKVYSDNGQKVFLKEKFDYKEVVESVERLNKTAKGMTYHYCEVVEKAKYANSK